MAAIGSMASRQVTSSVACAMPVTPHSGGIRASWVSHAGRSSSTSVLRFVRGVNDVEWYTPLAIGFYHDETAAMKGIDSSVRRAPVPMEEEGITAVDYAVANTFW